VKANLLAEGSSDRVLLPILRWVLTENTRDEVHVSWSNPRLFGAHSKLADKVQCVLELQPCDLLFVHRDADNQPPDWRRHEIANAVAHHAHVAVVPVRMTETWLLIDDSAIRAAAGRPRGLMKLGVPRHARLESLSDPKRLLRTALTKAHDASGRRAQRFKPDVAMHRLANLVRDWSPLRELSAFRRLEADTRHALAKLGVRLYPRDR